MRFRLSERTISGTYEVRKYYHTRKEMIADYRKHWVGLPVILQRRVGVDNRWVGLGVSEFPPASK